MSEHEPISNAKFTLTIGGQEIAATSVSGIGVNFETRSSPTALTQRSTEHRPGQATFDAISIDRPYVADGSAGSFFEDWAKACFEKASSPDTLKDGVINLVDENDAVIHAWEFTRGFLTKWSLSGLEAGSSDVLKESVTIAVNEWQTLMTT